MIRFLIIILAVLFSLPCMAEENEEIKKNHADLVPSGFSKPLEWRVGADIMPAYVFGTDGWLQGNNTYGIPVRSALSFNFRADFTFSPDSREGILYKNIYQGFGFGPNIFPGAQSLLGSPASFFVYQGAPFKHWGNKWSLGYEWQFGIGAGWDEAGGDSPYSESVVSTPVTAHMAVRLRLKYALSERWNLSLAVGGTHFSNGNTSWRNSGVNSAGVAIGAEYVLSPRYIKPVDDPVLTKEADKKRWFFDVIAFGAWRKRTVDDIPTKLIAWDGTPYIEDEEVLVPGKFPVFGLQVAPMRQLNRWVAVGGAFDLKWDKSAGLKPYWIEDTFYEDIKFRHVPFQKQISAGISAHAELTTPIFCVNGGIGINIINPKGDKIFYQQLAIKAFLTKNFFLNIGYGLGNFKNPNNLMLGAGYRL